MFEYFTTLTFEEFNGIIFFGVLISTLIFIFIEALKLLFDRTL